MFPVELCTGARVEAEEVGVEGDGAAEVASNVVRVDALQCNREFVTIRYVVAEKYICDYYFGF